MPAFDYYLAPGVAKTFRKEFVRAVYNALTFGKYSKVTKQEVSAIFKDCEIKLEMTDEEMAHLVDALGSYISSEWNVLSQIIIIAHDLAVEETNKKTYQAMEGFVHNLNTMHCLPGSERIWVEENGEIKLISMQELYNSYEPKKYKAFSLNQESFETELKYITGIKESGKNRKVFTITNEAGQKVTTTDNHKLMTVDNEGSLKEVYPKDITRTISPRNIPNFNTVGRIKIDKKPRKDSKHSRLNNLLYYNVKDKKEHNTGEEMTYDISVEDNETFLTEDFLFVHNSRAGSQVR